MTYSNCPIQITVHPIIKQIKPYTLKHRLQLKVTISCVHACIFIVIIYYITGYSTACHVCINDHALFQRVDILLSVDDSQRR